ncbi:MAG: 30S ribosomal protein S20 [Candidatus Ryanbacteria bacterium]|nr:30S ribosomal protein S20 [Candidatus Ryanbacteria bacterium]
MPNTASATKALRQSERRRVLNVRRKRSLRDVLKGFEKAILTKNKAEAIKLLPAVQKALDKTAKSGLIKKNNAARRKSRLAAQIKKLA